MVYDDDGLCLAVAGWRIMATTLVGRKLHVDDLVTTAAARSTGVGRALLAELAARAELAGCRLIALDSAVTRQDAHRFYFRERMPVVSFHFARPLPAPPGDALTRATGTDDRGAPPG